METEEAPDSCGHVRPVTGSPARSEIEQHRLQGASTYHKGIDIGASIVAQPL